MGRGICSICSSPIAEELNRALRDGKTKLRDLERRSGVSRSALSRHSRGCLPRAIIDAHREVGRFNPSKQQAFYLWPDGEIIPVGTPHGFRGIVRDLPNSDDLVIVVSFEDPIPPRSPKPEIQIEEAAQKG